MDIDLPVEIWQLILYSVLYTHSMFNPNPWQEYHRDQTDHIVANHNVAFQSQRSILRLVCKSWNLYVDSDHVKDMYYVQVGAPVIKNILTLPACARARRLDLSKMSNTWPGDTHSIKVTADMLAQAGIPSRRFKAEIIGGVTISGCDFLSDQSLFPHLKALYINLNQGRSSDVPAISTLLAIANTFKSLSCLYIHIGSWILYRGGAIFELPELTALTIISLSRVENFAFERWKLPSLTYLDIWGSRSTDELQRLLDVLPVLGRKLKTFITHLIPSTRNPNGEFALDTFWTNCPVLENLGFLLINTMHYPPPVSHPLKYIKNTGRMSLVRLKYDSLIGDYHAHVHHFCEAAQHLRTIVDNHDSDNYITTFNRVFPDHRTWIKTFAAVSQDFKTRGIRYEDKHGNTWEE